MSNISINLTPYLRAWAEERVKSGRYNNVSEVVREALRLLEYQEREREARVRDLRAALDAGVASGAAIPLDMDAIQREARAEWEARMSSSDRG